MPTNIFGQEEGTPSVYNGGEVLSGLSFDENIQKLGEPAKQTPPKDKEKDEKARPKIPIAEKTEEEIEAEKKEKESAEAAMNQFFGIKEEEKSSEDKDKLPDAPSTTPNDPNKDKVEGGEGKEGDDESEYAAISKELYKLGIFQAEVTDDGQEIQTIASSPEEFKELFESQSNQKAMDWLENFLTKFGEDRKAFWEAVFIHGVDPNKYFSISSKVEKLEGLDLTQESNAERVVREFLKRNNIPEASIDAQVKRLKDINELQNQAETYHPILLEQDKNALTQEAENAKKREANKAAQAKFYQNSIAKVLTEKMKEKQFDGIVVTEKVAQETFAFLNQPAYKLSNGDTLTEYDYFIRSLDKPENHALKVKLALLAQSNLDLTKVKVRAVTDETNTLFQNLKGKSIKQNSPKGMATTEPQGKWNDALK